MEPVCGSVGVGDGVVDTSFIPGVNPEPIGTGFALDVEPSFIETEYEAVFRDEHAEDLVDDRSVSELSNKENALLQ
jgi:hypothetical protein